MEVPCPSGLVFQARKWKIGDINTLLSSREDATSSLPLKMVQLAAQSVIEPGPYPFEKGGQIDWEQISHADISVANIAVRCGSGSDTVLLMHPNCAACRRLLIDPVEVDLLDLPIYMAREEGRVHLHSGQPIERTVEGHKVWLRAIRGSHMPMMAKLQDQEAELMLEVLTCMSIEAVMPKGRKDGKLTNLPDIRKFWREQSWGFKEAIEEDVDTLFGGIDMRYSFTCDRISCRVEQEQTVPLDPSFYGLDLESRQSRRVKRSSAKSLRDLMPKR